MAVFCTDNDLCIVILVLSRRFGLIVHDIVRNDYHSGVRRHFDVSISVIDLNIFCTDNVNKPAEMCVEVKVELIVSKVKSHINGLVSLNLLKEKLLVGYHDPLISSCSESRISAVSASEFNDMLVKFGILALHIRKVQAGAKIVVGVVFFTALNTIFTSVIYRGNTGHCIHEGVNERQGSLTAVGAVSPPGGDLSEPVSQATMRIVKVFWALDSSLAYRRHFPAINWLNSYSLYLDSLRPWYSEHLGHEFLENREWAMAMLQEESNLNEIVQLVGKDSLSAKDQITLEVARMIREDFLQQNSFADNDAYSEYDRQARMLAMIRQYDTQCLSAAERGGNLSELFAIPAREKIGRAKGVPADQYKDAYANLLVEMEEQIAAIAEKGEKEE